MGVVLPQPVQFGKYTLFERIGRGGMADVFKARVQGPGGFERIFVVKRILPHLSDDPTFTRMFIDEAKLSARLSHPNIVQVFELGNVDAEYFISMEYVRGRDLAESMRALWARVGPPRPELVAYAGREMCRALAYAHDLVGDDGTPLGMIHRDVSPSNVMLSFDGSVKLLDFGIAKALGGDQQEDSASQHGTLKGKFAYMAPEQTQGNDVDRRIDIFATGIVLHEVLTGRRLFKGDNDLQTVERVRQCDVPPPSRQNPLCPPELDAIVCKALAKRREDRFQTASDMADALDDVVHAARFQPTHLAALMRDLFPTDMADPRIADPRITTGSVRMGASVTGSGSAPSHTGSRSSSVMRSPTIPPISRFSSMRPTPGPETGPYMAAKPFYKRSVTWVAATLLVVAFVGGGALWSRSTTRSRTHAAGPHNRSGVLKIPLVVSSAPDGADVFLAGSSAILGKTPFKGEFEWSEDRQTFLVFKLKGYEDVIREVKPTWTGFVQLKPAPAFGRIKVDPLEAPPPPADKTTPVPAPPTPELPPVPAPPLETRATNPAPGDPTGGGERPSGERPAGSLGGKRKPKKPKPTDLVSPF